jgi:hypothetical protein
MTLKGLAIAVGAVALAFLAGWLTAASGRSALEQERTQYELRAIRAEARTAILDGRVSVLLTNFGDAVQHFQEARNAVGQLQIALRESNHSDVAGRLEIVITHLSDAQQLSGQLDRRAQDEAAAADKALTSVTD